jgi:hypothetical protein
MIMFRGEGRPQSNPRRLQGAFIVLQKEERLYCGISKWTFRTFRTQGWKTFGDTRRDLKKYRKRPPCSVHCIVQSSWTFAWIEWHGNWCHVCVELEDSANRTLVGCASSYRPRQAFVPRNFKPFTSSLTRPFRPSNGHSMTYATAAPTSSNGQPQGPVSYLLLRCCTPRLDSTKSRRR